MDVRTYLRAIRQSWSLIVVAVLLGGAAGYVYSARQTPVYAASVGFYVSTTATATTNAQSTDQYAQSQAVNLAKLASGDTTARAVQHAGVQLPRAVIAAEITASAPLNTVVLSVTVMDTSRGRALQIARALAQRFPDVARRYTPSGTRSAQLTIKPFDFPAAGPAPVLPRTKLDVAFGMFAGLVLGLLLAVLRLLRDTSVRTREDLERIGRAPLIGDIGYDASARDAPLVLERQARSVRAEAFRQLRTSLQFVDAAGRLQTLLITSSTESEGKSTTAINLALMFAETQRSVLLIGADLRRPRVAAYLGLESSIGLTNVLVNQVSIDDALQAWGTDGMYVLAGGAIPPNPSELLGSAHMAELMARLRRRFDIIIIDTPPLLPVTDAAVLAAHADGVVVVCRHGRTHRAQLAVAVRALQAVNARVVGTVLTMRPARGPDSEQYNSSYRYYGEVAGGPLRRRLAHAARRMPLLGRALRHRDAEAFASAERSEFDRAVPVSLLGAGTRAPAFDARVGTPPLEPAVPTTVALDAVRRRQDRPHRGRRRRIPVDEDTVPAQAGPAQAGPAQTGPAQAGPAQTGPAQTVPDDPETVDAVLPVTESATPDDSTTPDVSTTPDESTTPDDSTTPDVAVTPDQPTAGVADDGPAADEPAVPLDDTIDTDEADDAVEAVDADDDSDTPHADSDTDTPYAGTDDGERDSFDEEYERDVGLDVVRLAGRHPAGRS